MKERTFAMIKPWHWEWTTHCDLNWYHVVVGVGAWLIGFACGADAATKKDNGE